MICKICNSERIKLLSESEYYNLLKCRNCGTVISKWNKGVTAKKLYSKDYFINLHKSFFSENRYNKKYNLYESVLYKIKKLKKNGKILDIGCGIGEFLGIAKRYGYDAYGIDISDYAINNLKKDFGKKVFVSNIKNLDFKNEYFDIISMWDVLEHLPNPKKTIKEINKKLKKNGLIIILTPNEDSLIYKLAQFIYKISFNKIKKQLHLVYPIHNTFVIPEKVLIDMLEKNKFKIVYKKRKGQPISTIEGGIIRKTILGVLYFLSFILNKQIEILIVAKKLE